MNTVTAVVALLFIANTVGWLIVAGYRLLVGHHSLPWRFMVAVAGLGYGLTGPLRASRVGQGLLVIGIGAAISLVVDSWRWIMPVRQGRSGAPGSPSPCHGPPRLVASRRTRSGTRCARSST
jgi:hypothetical protein